jgi:hypothetical protein
MTVEQEPVGDADLPVEADQADAPPVPAGDDVRVGPEQSDEPQAGATEPTD